MPYANYAYYQTEYGGTLVPAGEFDALAAQAGAAMEAACTPALAGYAGRPFVRRCCCAVAEELYQTALERAAGGPLAAEKRGGISRSWAVSAPGNARLRQTPAQRIYGILAAHLGAFGLLYRGVAG